MQASNNSPLISLETDLKIFSETIKEVSMEILDEGISKFPIFIAHQHEANIGELLLAKDEFATEWNIHASTIEEFVQKGIIQKEKQEFFELNYKDPKKFMCVFVMVPEGANFVFFRYH